MIYFLVFVLVGVNLVSWFVVKLAREFFGNHDKVMREDIEMVKRGFPKAFLEESHSNVDIEHYYDSTQWDYWLLGRFFGPSMHTTLKSPFPTSMFDGFKQTALVYGVAMAGNAKRIIEVGSGMGYTSMFLSEIPDSDIVGIDLTPRHVDISNKLAGNLTNVLFAEGDVLDVLAQEDDDDVDLIFGIESLCNLGSLENVRAFLMMATCSLKKGGSLYIIDGFRAKMDGDAGVAMMYAEKGFRIRRMVSKEDWITMATNMGFKLEADVDMTREAIPFWVSGWIIAHVLLKFPWLINYLATSRFRESAANLLSISMVAHALVSGSAKYGSLHFKK